jgi:hypothetical protein
MLICGFCKHLDSSHDYAGWRDHPANVPCTECTDEQCVIIPWKDQRDEKGDLDVARFASLHEDTSDCT